MAHGRIVWSGAVLSGLPRRVTRGVQDAFGSVAGRRDPLVPPRSLRGDPPGGFVAAGGDVLNLLIGLGKLSPDERVVELGCGYGKAARALADYLGPGASYDGVDPNAAAVAWCSQAYANRIDFHFHASAFDAPVPLPDASHEVVLIDGLLPRLEPAVAERVLAEAHRLLVPDGRLFALCFLLDDSARAAIAAGEAAVDFAASDGVSASAPDGLRAYEEEWVLDRIAQAGFRKAGIRHGTWTPRPTGRAHEDIVVARA